MESAVSALESTTAVSSCQPSPASSSPKRDPSLPTPQSTTVLPAKNAGDYTVGWICALSTEYVAAQVFLDERHSIPDKHNHDNNDYTLGGIGRHLVVIAVLPEGRYGLSSATSVAKSMLHSFPNIRIGLMVGIGGGAPSSKHDIRLGDIVVSAPRGGHGGVFQYDFGKTIQDQTFCSTGGLNQPPEILLTAVNGLKSQYEIDGHQLDAAINNILEQKPRLRKKYRRPNPNSDRLYRSHVVHPKRDDTECEMGCGDGKLKLITRRERKVSEDTTYESYKDRVGDRVEGTCEWFLRHEHFKNWLRRDSGPLVVSADPGCGKSVLAKYLINERLPRSATTCYFFFKSQLQNTVRQALCALLHQLFSYKPSLITHAMNEFKKNGKELVNSTTSLWLILENAVRDPLAGPIIIVLDALDECAEVQSQDLIQRIKSQFSSGCSSRLRYLLTSRPYEQLMAGFTDLIDLFPYIRIPGEDNSESISREVNHVIRYQVQQIAKEKRLSGRVKNHLEDKMLRIPHRTYLWAYLVFDYLKMQSFKKTRKGIDDTIEAMPTSIYEAYEQILTKSHQQKSMVHRALSMILVASRPLTVSEMNVALNVDYKSKSIHDLDVEEDIDFKSRLRNWTCSTLVSYALSICNPGSKSWSAWFARYWKSEGHKRTKGFTSLMISSYFGHQATAKHLLERGANINRADTEYGRTPLLWATVRGHRATVRLLLEKGADIETADTTYSRTPLIWAVVNKHEAIVKLLLKKGANIEATDATFGHIQLSSAESLANAKLLLKGANIEADDAAYGRTSLLWAVVNEHEAIVKLLLEKGANVEVVDVKFSQTPLLWAVENSHEAIVKLLLEKGANIETADAMNGRTPLLWAAVRGHKEIAKLLLTKSANIETADAVCGRTPLLWVAERGHEAIAKRLLEKGANIEAVDTECGRTPLFWAAVNGHEAIVKLLLKKGANIEAADAEYGQTPLSWAVVAGHEATVKLLLKKGANVEAIHAGYDLTSLSWGEVHGY
ncbi:hypothetical protein FE257_003988 [Aspergillus nanangensis]|uniref:Uncharacterized protein n=1 Tax=Aspergillus nanangensis TaxID=2582783 RepID=A0AAD4GW63_ASPNN|nr:hypothetical protein FE257_003988 [Aspergillus nanangensis]